MPNAENKWSQRLLLALTILWLVAGAGLFSYMGTVPSPLNSNIVRVGGFVLADGKEKLWQNAPVSLRLDLDRYESEIAKAQSVLLTLGGSYQPITLRINYQTPLRYRLNAFQLEIGSQIALTPGQLRHSIIKAWILQTTDTRFGSSILRLNVLADALIATTQNGLSLTSPKNRELYFGQEGGTFAEQISTLGSHCQSAWVPVEVLHLCESVKPEHTMHEEIIAFSLRRTLVEGIWASISELTAFERVQFLKAWVSYLGQKKEESQVNGISPSSPVGVLKWLTWARGEFDDLLPSDVLGSQKSSALKRNYLNARASAEKYVGLLPDTEIPVDIAARFESEDSLDHFANDMNAKKVQIGLPSFRAAVVQFGDTSWLLPGHVPLTQEDLSRIKTRRSIWETCKYPSVDRVLKSPINSDRALLVKRCSGDKVKPLYRSYIAYGVEGFAIDNPDLQFVQIHKPSLEFAAEKGLMAHADFFQNLGEDFLTKTDRKLGLTDAQWNQQVGAFRVLGAIEAIEWFRVVKPSPN